MTAPRPISRRWNNARAASVQHEEPFRDGTRFSVVFSAPAFSGPVKLTTCTLGAAMAGMDAFMNGATLIAAMNEASTQDRLATLRAEAPR